MYNYSVLRQGQYAADMHDYINGTVMTTWSKLRLVNAKS
jgi:hypothetical protein